MRYICSSCGKPCKVVVEEYSPDVHGSFLGHRYIVESECCGAYVTDRMTKEIVTKRKLDNDYCRENL